MTSKCFKQFCLNVRLQSLRYRTLVQKNPKLEEKKKAKKLYNFLLLIWLYEINSIVTSLFTNLYKYKSSKNYISGPEMAENVWTRPWTISVQEVPKIIFFVALRSR